MQNGPDEALEIVEKRREAKGKEKKERYTHSNAEFQRIARRDKKAFLKKKERKKESLPQGSRQRNRGKQ